MDRILLYILVALVIPIYIKWIIFFVLLPFQVIDIHRREAKRLTGKRVWRLYILSAPYLIWEKYIMHGGWSRYMMFQIGVAPSMHFSSH